MGVSEVLHTSPPKKKKKELEAGLSLNFSDRANTQTNGKREREARARLDWVSGARDTWFRTTCGLECFCEMKLQGHGFWSGSRAWEKFWPVRLVWSAGGGSSGKTWDGRDRGKEGGGVKIEARAHGDVDGKIHGTWRCKIVDD